MELASQCSEQCCRGGIFSASGSASRVERFVGGRWVLSKRLPKTRRRIEPDTCSGIATGRVAAPRRCGSGDVRSRRESNWRRAELLSTTPGGCGAQRSRRTTQLLCTLLFSLALNTPRHAKGSEIGPRVPATTRDTRHDAPHDTRPRGACGCGRGQCLDGDLISRLLINS